MKDTLKDTIRYVVTCYKKRNNLHWQEKYPLRVIEDCLLDAWCNTPNETIAIRTYYMDVHLLTNNTMSAAVDINIKKLTAKYKVTLSTNKNKYRNYKVTYSCIEDLLYSVINYLSITQETKMSYKNLQEKIK